MRVRKILLAFCLFPVLSVAPSLRAASDFLFPLIQDSGSVILSADSTVRGTVDLVDGSGVARGAWVNDGCWEGNRSWAAMGGELRVKDLILDSAFTLEIWFKLTEIPNDSLPLIRLESGFPAPDSGVWSVGLTVTSGPDSILNLRFQAPGDTTTEAADVFRLNEWLHLAWVGKGGKHEIFVNASPVLSTNAPNCGKRLSKKTRLSLASCGGAENEAFSGRTLALFDCLKITSKALKPYWFLTPQCEAEHSDGPNLFYLYSNFPNPFSPSTTYKILVPRTGLPPDIRFEVYNTKAELVRTIPHGEFLPGMPSFQWNGMDDNGRRVISGVYFIMVRKDGKIIWRTKTVLLF